MLWPLLQRVTFGFSAVLAPE